MKEHGPNNPIGSQILFNVPKPIFYFGISLKHHIAQSLLAELDNNIQANKKLIKQIKFSNAVKDVKNAVEEVVQNGANAILFTTNKLANSEILPNSSAKRRQGRFQTRNRDIPIDTIEIFMEMRLFG